jgi:hypothetical protein
MLFSDPDHSPSESLPAELRDYPEWRRGRSRYSVWILPVECPTLLKRIADLRRQLSDLLLPSGARQPHISLFVCGFRSGLQRYDDDFSCQQRQQQLRAMGRQPRTAFTLQIGQPDSFASAAFLPVQDPSGQLQAWRSRMAEHGAEVRQSPYLPHLTLGLYRQRLPAALIRQRLAALADNASPYSLPISRLCYATYRARDLNSPLQVHHSLHLPRLR